MLLHKTLFLTQNYSTSGSRESDRSGAEFELKDQASYNNGHPPGNPKKNEVPRMLRTAGNRITWLGHSTLQMTTSNGKIILIDPWVEGNPSFPASMKSFPRVDLILATHGHHMGDVVSLALAHNAPVVANFELALYFGSKGVVNILPMGKGGTQRVGDVDITLVHAVHSSSIEEDGKRLYTGEAAGLVVRLPGGFTLYHAGDTAVFGDMKIIGELYKPDLVCLPIGGHFTMGSREAVYAIRLLGVPHVLPIHYGTFPVLTGTPEELRDLTQDIAGLEIHALKPGESIGESKSATA
jgi:L-ascorbate metabolism protein UlaG (beta-lactamase superfamily)